MKRKQDEIFLRNNTAKAYKYMRSELRGANPPEPKDPPPQGFSWWKIAIFLAVFGAICWLLSGHAWANDMKASYYSEKSLKVEGTWRKSGGIMANGRKFDENALTCATGKQYKLGSRLLVTNKATGKSVVCVVTDRIARRFYNSRVDLSKGAFLRLGTLKDGLLNVSVDKVAIILK